LTDKPSPDALSERAAVAQRAHDTLVVAIEEMRRRLRLSQEPLVILNAIKQAMHVGVPPHDFTVCQTLFERERQNAFNSAAADEFPTAHKEFEQAIRDCMLAHKGRAPAKQLRMIARNAWRQDPGADRRIREMEYQPADQWRSPYRGRPELYDRGVVLAFENAVAHAIGRSRISWTRGTEDNKSRSAMLDVLVAAVQWAMCVAWQFAGQSGSKPVKVKAEGLLGIIKALPPATNSTD
jgi:hypothetical protein